MPVDFSIRSAASAMVRTGRVVNDAEKIDLAREFPPPKAGSILTNALGMKFAYVPAGSFWMGGGAGKPGEKLVEIASAFYMGVHPVTQGDWQAVMGNNPSYSSRSGEGKDRSRCCPTPTYAACRSSR